MIPDSPFDREVARRRAEKMAQLLELGLEPAVVAPLTTESLPVGPRTWKVSQVRPAMGTVVAASVLHASRDLAEHAAGRAFEEMDRLIDLLNRYDPRSAVTALNERGRLHDVPPELDAVVEGSLEVYRLSGGAFDVTVKPLVDLFRDARTADPLQGPAPDVMGGELRAATELVGSDGIERRDRGIGFARQGMGVTLDGIAKGYIVDAMAARLSEEGATSFLINAGGDVRTRGRRDGRLPWTVAVEDPAKEGGFPDVIQVVDGAVATSGSYEIYFDRERLVHHIVSADSGRSPSDSTSVTVTAPSAMMADALATAAFVMGPQRALALIDGLAGCECLILDGQGRQAGSKGWRRRFLSATEPRSPGLVKDTPNS